MNVSNFFLLNNLFDALTLSPILHLGAIFEQLINNNLIF